MAFCWGVRKGTINFYESFTLQGVKYSLYDTVLLSASRDEPYIGKLVRLMEMENHEKKAEILWFFRPADIVHCLGGVRPLGKEIFLACGEGAGLMNVNPLDAIVRKCNVVCSSKDKRNPQPTEEELRRAEFIFHRCFDVGRNTISEEFPSSISGIEVAHFFNRKSRTISSVASEPKAHLKARNEVEPVRATKNDQSARVKKGFNVLGNSGGGQMNSSIKDRPQAGGFNVLGTSGGGQMNSPMKDRPQAGGFKVGGGQMNSSMKDRPQAGGFNVPGTSSGGQLFSSIKDRPQAGGNMKRSEHVLSASPSDIGPAKKRKVVPSSLDIDSSGKGPEQHVGPSISYEYSEVTRKPGMDASKWLKLEVWGEVKLNEANEKGTLVVLENLDPSFTSSEVEDIVWNVFREHVKAKMVQCTAFSSPHSGQALVIFKSKEAADNACSKLATRCLVLGDGRPIFGRRRRLRKDGDASKFVGHLSIDRTRSHRQREEVKNAVATSHFSQGNTVEFEMAIQWRALQEKANKWLAALHEKQGKDIEDLMKQMKVHCSE